MLGDTTIPSMVSSGTFSARGEAIQRQDGDGILSICATIMDKSYRPSQLPIVVDLEPAHDGHAP